MSSRSSVMVKLGMYWNSIWMTSGRPLPDFRTCGPCGSAARPGRRSASFTLMFGYAFSNIFTASSVPGVQAQTVRLAGFLSSAAMSTFSAGAASAVRLVVAAAGGHGQRRTGRPAAAPARSPRFDAPARTPPASARRAVRECCSSCCTPPPRIVARRASPRSRLRRSTRTSPMRLRARGRPRPASAAAQLLAGQQVARAAAGTASVAGSHDQFETKRTRPPRGLRAPVTVTASGSAPQSAFAAAGDGASAPSATASARSGSVPT